VTPRRFDSPSERNLMRGAVTLMRCIVCHSHEGCFAESPDFLIEKSLGAWQRTSLNRTRLAVDEALHRNNMCETKVSQAVKFIQCGKSRAFARPPFNEPPLWQMFVNRGEVSTASAGSRPQIVGNSQSFLVFHSGLTFLFKRSARPLNVHQPIAFEFGFFRSRFHEFRT